MKSICIFNGNMSEGGGTQRMAQILANVLDLSGIFSNIIVLSLNNPENNSYFILNEKVQHESLQIKNGILQKFKVINALHSFLKKNHIDIMINVDITLGLFAFPARLFLNTKIVSWEMFNFENDIGFRYIRQLRQFCLKFGNYYVNQTRRDMESFQKSFKVRCPITYLYNPIELNNEYNDYNDQSKILMTAGHFFYTKGFDLAVDVAKIVFFRHPDWKWHFYGDGDEMEKVKTAIDATGLSEQVILCGRIKNITFEYKKASMYVMTSRLEGFGLVLTEAKSYNLPTLAFDIPCGPGEIIEDNISGYLIKMFDTVSMADKICELIDDQQKRKSFSKHAKDNLNKFSNQAFTQRWIEILSEEL